MAEKCPKCGTIMSVHIIIGRDTSTREVIYTCPNCGHTETYREPNPPDGG